MPFLTLFLLFAIHCFFVYFVHFVQRYNASTMTIVTFEGFSLPSGYIIREMTIMFSNGEYDHFRFKAPQHFTPTITDVTTIQYTSNNLLQLPFHDKSLLPYETVFSILRSLSHLTLYSVGQQALEVLTTNLPFTRVVNVGSRFGFKYPTALPPVNCGRRHNTRYCSLAKAICLRDFMNAW